MRGICAEDFISRHRGHFIPPGQAESGAVSRAGGRVMPACTVPAFQCKFLERLHQFCAVLASDLSFIRGLEQPQPPMQKQTIGLNVYCYDHNGHISFSSQFKYEVDLFVGIAGKISFGAAGCRICGFNMELSIPNEGIQVPRCRHSALECTSNPPIEWHCGRKLISSETRNLCTLRLDVYSLKLCVWDRRGWDAVGGL